MEGFWNSRIFMQNNVHLCRETVHKFHSIVEGSMIRSGLGLLVSMVPKMGNHTSQCRFMPDVLA